MNKSSFIITTAVILVVLVSPVVGQAGPRSHPVGEDAALNLLVRTLTRDHVYKNRISSDCINYQTEETTDAYFQFLLREIHNAKCGGDPDTNPTVASYRVYRASHKIKWLKVTDDSWQAYDHQKVR